MQELMIKIQEKLEKNKTFKVDPYEIPIWNLVMLQDINLILEAQLVILEHLSKPRIVGDYGSSKQ